MLILLVNLLIFAIVFGLLFYAVRWVMGYLSVPEPVVKIITVIFIVIAVICLIELLVGNLIFIGRSGTLSYR
jgi:hypothetical protein